MPIEIWFTFVIASTILVAIPGPTVMLVVSHAMGAGRRSGWATVPGVALGDVTAMTVSLAGAGAVLAASATLFTLLKLAGPPTWSGSASSCGAPIPPPRCWRRAPSPRASSACSPAPSW